MRKPLKRKRYVVGLVDGDQVTEHEIEVAPADMLRAEIEGRRYGIASPQEAPIHTATLWVYLALVRLELYAGSWQQFSSTDLYDFEPLAEDAPVDPTQPDTSGSASPSPSTSETPATG